jgi:spore germination protein GerM
MLLATPEGETRPITIYLPRRFLDDALGLQAVARSVPADQEPAHAALAALIAGPDGDERADDFQYPLDRRTQIRAVRVEDHVAVVDLGAEIDRVRGRPFSELVYWSIVYTLTEVPSVERVALRREGEVLAQLGDPFFAVPAAAGRAEAPAWARPRTEARSTPVPP